jgi:molecular chaperone GrpE
VLQVYQVGYLIEDRCLRPAMVVVSKGGPKNGKTAEPAPQPPSGP